MTPLERALRELHRAEERFDDAHAAWVRALEGGYPREMIVNYRHEREVAHAAVVQARDAVEGLR